MASSAPFAARLPLYALDLARRYWAPLLCVWFLADFLHRMALRGMAKLSGFEPVLGYAVLGIVLLLQLAGYIVMFHLLRPALPNVDAEYRRMRAGEGRRTIGEAERNVVDAVAMAILPFLIFYSAWDLLAEEFRQFLTTAVNDQGLDTLFDLGAVEMTGPLLAIALGAFGLRALFEHLYNRSGNKAAGVATALFESTWMFLGVFTVVQMATSFWTWMSGRAAAVAVHDAAMGTLAWFNELVFPLPLQAAVLGAVTAAATVWEMLKGAFVEPVLWLTITAVIYGAQMDRYSGLFRRGSRADRMEQALTRKGPFKAGARWLRRDAADKYVPFLNAFRFILGVSPVFYLSFSLYYVLLELGFDWMERGIYTAVGPGEFLGFWWPWLEPMEIALEAVKYLLRICLLAAAFELILRASGGPARGRRARSSAPA
ncbi:hypothetical protein [Nocardiopsis coralliicola]